MDNAVALAALTLAGTIAAGFFTLVNKQNRTHEKLATAMDKVAKSNQDIAKEAKKGNVEAKERNGHLAELTIQSSEQMLKAIQTIREQHVDHQTVVKQEVNKAIVPPKGG